jgi:hypothetical protein
LSADRPLQLGFGVALIGQIPFTAICAFAERYGIGDDEFDSFARVLRLVDAAVVSELNSKKT